MDVFKLLKQDHDEVKKLFKKLEESSEGAKKTREKTFKELARELTIHTKVEEDIVYPRLREEEELRDIVNEGIEEHHVVDQVLEEMAAMPVDDEQWTAKFSVLKEQVEHHVKGEEKELFPKAAKLIDEDELEEMAQTVEDEKKEIQKGSHKSAQETFTRLGL